MAGQLKIGGNVIATHAGTEGAGTVTLDSSTLTIGSNTTIQGAMNAGSITSAVDFPAGHVIQYKSVDINSQQSTNQTSFQHISAYDLAITPQYNNSKIILFYSGNWYINNQNRHGYFTYYRDSTHLGDSSEGIRLYQTSGSAGKWHNANVCHIDTPNTTSSVTYKIYIRSQNTDSTFRINYNSNYFSNFSLTEIKV